jgi:formiminoglutamase
LEDFLSPLPSHLGELNSPDSLGHIIEKHMTALPDWEDADVAIVGISEGRNTKNKETSLAANQIRKELYQLISASTKAKLVDLGNIEAGKTFNDTQFALQEVCKTLLANSIVPVLIGGSKELAYAQYASFQTIVKNLEATIISPIIDLDNHAYLNKICLHEPNFLFNINAIAYQSHYVLDKAVSALRKLFFNPTRLGVLRSNISDVEPVLRNTDMTVFDIGAIKQADAPGNHDNNPSGLTSEEACQLCWYAGISEKMRSFGIYEVNPEYDYRNTTSKLGAQMIWYFLDGYYNRKGDHPEMHKEFLKYRCTMVQNEPDVVFYKSKRTERWWMEIPGPTSAKNMVIPCTYTDYTMATKGEMPDLFFKALQKNLK